MTAAHPADDLARAAILVLGASRSGTSWLAKILDSHPDVLYRHEPDEVVPARPDATAHQQLRDWIAESGVRAATNAPFFRKSWRPASLDLLRTTLARSFNGADRLLAATPARSWLKVPDFVPADRSAGVRAVIKLVFWDGSAAARELPESRTLFILRHPCGQVASVMRGEAQRRFERRRAAFAAPPQDDEAALVAASRGVDAAMFQALPDAAKHAWRWVAFNEAALDGLKGLPNARVVLYEDLCVRPEAVARDLFDFAHLAWNPQTAAFIARSSSHDGPAGYYAVFRRSVAAAERWRNAMDPTDQAAVREVVRRSRLGAYWPDLAGQR